MVKWFLNHECLSLSFCGSAILKALMHGLSGAISKNSQQGGRRENTEEPYSYICAYRMVNWKQAEKWSPARQLSVQFPFYYQWRKEATSVDSCHHNTNSCDFIEISMPLAISHELFSSPHHTASEAIHILQFGFLMAQDQ